MGFGGVPPPLPGKWANPTEPPPPPGGVGSEKWDMSGNRTPFGRHCEPLKILPNPSRSPRRWHSYSPAVIAADETLGIQGIRVINCNHDPRIRVPHTYICSS